MRLLMPAVLICVIVCPSQSQDFPGLQGWSATSEVSTYLPDNLWEYINGAAELFLAYGFQSLRSCDLKGHGISITVDIYDMGNCLNAYGIYTTERPDELSRLPIGGEAIVAPPYQGLLLKNRYYVKADIFDGELTEAIGKTLLAQIAGALPGDDGLPGELQLLPAEDMIAGSEGFVREGYLGLSELENVLFARYLDEDERTFEYFYLVTMTEQTSEHIWGKLLVNWEKIDHRGSTVLIRALPYRGMAGIALSQGQLWGVSESKDIAELRRRLDAIR